MHDATIDLFGEHVAKDGRQADVEKLVAEIVEAARREPGTLAMEWYTADRTAYHVFERYRDSAAVLAHFGNLGPLAQRYMAVADIKRVVCYGDPSPDARAALAAFGAQIMPRARGFDRQTVIGTHRDVVTVIFEFDVEPDQQQPLHQGIRGLVDEIVSRQPGFVSANLHLSKDGKKVINYFQWESQAAFDAFRADEDKQRIIRSVIAQYGPKPRVYDVVLSADRLGVTTAA